MALIDRKFETVIKNFPKNFKKVASFILKSLKFMKLLS